ncbi:MAG: hypothetical protein JOY53_03340 [Acidobacteriaceae bacterium]|nr:hypothetical protein [Acidobacteriaceae bacterium]
MRTAFELWSRPPYAYGVWNAAQQARALGLKMMSAIEFGVAGGNGLLALENISEKISAEIGVQIIVYGFDSGIGMPQASDFRDLPHVWQRGFYRMDAEKLRRRLGANTHLVLGEVSNTIPETASSIPPVGFIAFDLDYYSSTKSAFNIFDTESSRRLPRVYCYFDDIMYPEWACHNPYVGELRAISEFNEEHNTMKLSPIHLLRGMRPHPQAWNDQIYILHDFEHPDYNTNLTIRRGAVTEKPLK